MTTETFSVFSEKPESAFNFGLNAFERAGAYFGLFARPAKGSAPGTVGDWGCTDVYVNSRRGSIVKNKTNNLLVKLTPTHEGEKIPFAVSATPTEFSFLTAYGRITCCFAEPSLILAKGENGLGLCFEADLGERGIVRKRGAASFELGFHYVCSLVFSPVEGCMSMDAPWSYEQQCMPSVRGDMAPGEDGAFLMAIEEFPQLGIARDAYPTYEEGLADVTADWEAFLAKQPELSGDLAPMREKAAYITWSHLVSPSGLIKRTYLYMYPAMPASSWQMCENAVCLSNNLDVAIELLLTMIDRQSPEGQFPDFYDDTRYWDRCYKPPLEGWALDILMKRRDLAKDVPQDKLVQLYEGYSKWVDWFMKYRDDDHDGIPQYEHGDETGNDDSTLFNLTNKIELPELCAFLALLEEKLGDLAIMIGREGESEAWYQKSKDLIAKMIDTFWTGERFVGRTFGDHRIIDATSIHFYRPLILGHRLPAEIVDKMIADLMEEGGFLTPYGFLSERITSIDYSRSSFGWGAIGSSDNIIIITSLYYAGATEFAKEAARRFCKGVMGIDTPFWPAQVGFPGTWGACAFQIMADIACNR